MPLVMRLETAAAMFARQVKIEDYDITDADMRDLLREAAIRIKQLEHDIFLRSRRTTYGPVTVPASVTAYDDS